MRIRANFLYIYSEVIIMLVLKPSHYSNPQSCGTAHNVHLTTSAMCNTDIHITLMLHTK